MNPKNQQHTVFFTALAVLTVAFVGGFAYFQTSAAPQGLLADIGEVAVQPAVETIPTSTIIVTDLDITPTSTTAAPTSTPTAAPVIAPLKPLSLPYSFNATTATSTYWPKYWGGISFTKNGFALIPDSTTRGANSFIESASSWSDYAVSANVSSLEGGWFDIVARVANHTQNFVYCEFGPNGTEAIERVDGNDTQLALTSASTTDNTQGASENFGMKVYGNDIACTMNGQEVVGASVTNSKEAPAGGIGFVIFGAPQDQKEVSLSNISVTALTRDTIVVPFPVALPSTPPAPAPTSPATTTPAPTPAPTPTPIPAPIVTTTTKTLPYFTDTFSKDQGWNTYWGNFSISANALNIAAADDSTSGGVLLDGTNAWNNYTFTANFNWIKGQTFTLYARYTDAQNYVACVFTQPYLGGLQISLEQHVNGNGYILAQGTVTTKNQGIGSAVTASIQVLNTQGNCSFDNSVISSQGEGFTLNPPFTGRIGIAVSDPNNNKAQIIVNSLTVTPKS